MNGFRNLSILTVILLVFALIMTIIGALARGVRAGSIDPKLLAGGVAGLTLLVVVGVFAAVIRIFRRHKQHTRQASSADILAEIMAMKDTDNDGKEDSENGK